MLNHRLWFLCGRMNMGIFSSRLPLASDFSHSPLFQHLSCYIPQSSDHKLDHHWVWSQPEWWLASALMGSWWSKAWTDLSLAHSPSVTPRLLSDFYFRSWLRALWGVLERLSVSKSESQDTDNQPQAPHSRTPRAWLTHTQRHMHDTHTPMPLLVLQFTHSPLSFGYSFVPFLIFIRRCHWEEGGIMT